MRKDFRGFVAVIGERLRQDALDHNASRKKGDPQDDGILMGYAFALDAMWDHLEMFGLAPADLNWKGFVPERDLLGTRAPPGAARKRP